MKSVRLYFFCFLFLGTIEQSSAQIDNSIFDYNQNNANEGFHVTSLQYCKNNEYAEKSNPGQTFFGQQLRLSYSSVISDANNVKTKINLGTFIQYDYGDNTFPSNFLPIAQIQFSKKNNWTVNAGSLNSNTNHGLQESLINWEWTFRKPIEYGLQFVKKKSFLNYETWVDWRQFAKIKTSQQEIISFGQHLEINPLGSNHSGIFKIPISTLIYHQGGESLKLPKPVTTNANVSVGISIGLPDSALSIEYYHCISKDLSQNLTHAFGNGISHQMNVKFKLSKSNQLALTYFNASQFFAPLGAPIFLSEYPGSAYNQSRIRNFVMARYQYLTNFGKNIMFDLRIEPIYHLNTGLFAFSTGLYLRYSFN